MPTAAMLLAALLWATVFVGAKAAVATSPVAAAAALRLLAGAAALWLLAQARRRPARRRPGGWFLTGLLHPGLSSLLLFWSLTLGSAVTVAALWSLLPALDPLLRRREPGARPAPSAIGGGLLALAGAALLAAQRGEAGADPPAALALALGGLLCIVIHQRMAERAGPAAEESPSDVAWRTAAAFLLAAGAMALPFQERHLPPPEPRVWLLLAYLGAVASIAPLALHGYALRRLPAARIGALSALAAPLALPLAALLLDEPAGALDMAAALLIPAGAALPAAVAWAAARPRAPDPPLRELELVVLDTETTGMRPGAGDELVQLGAVVVRDGRLAETYEEVVDPGRPIPAVATAVHGLSDAQTAGRASARDGARRFEAFAAGRALVAYDASFDLAFLRRHAAFDQPTLCLLRLARAVEGGRDCTLEALAKRHGVSLAGRHTAPGDARIAAELLLRLLPAAEARGFGTLRRALDLAGLRPRGL